ncbi:YtzI protein [Bacillus halotolerans]|uniref:YtzI protein n=1 Tax=Bacillus mojavensis TaxID=72360 RepID=A0AAP3CPC4_BACMO|nr:MULTISPECIES: YtzI protein [Bacillus mojavensis subgroup]MCY8508801.1 YtzI protein [Bacillus mojavensis]MEC1671324.1 YtzI protein [Bacillus mojavensis]MEC3589537.1 YtzI protein [Bacillus mojavensis]MEC3759823.1 YtzI protein [Bacillus halotolerans]MEC5243539.1 YtzI protein [Bacillus mojavensis]
MTLLITISILIVLAVLLVSVWTTVKAYNVKHTIDPPQEGNAPDSDPKGQ